MGTGGKATPRDLTPILQKFRDYMLGRKYINSARFFEYNMAPRSPPPPKLPDGPHSRLHDVAYCSRDARNFKDPPLIVVESPGAADRKQLVAGGEVAEKHTPVADLTRKLPKLVTPGRPYQPKTENPHCMDVEWKEPKLK